MTSINLIQLWQQRKRMPLLLPPLLHPKQRTPGKARERKSLLSRLLLSLRNPARSSRFWLFIKRARLMPKLLLLASTKQPLQFRSQSIRKASVPHRRNIPPLYILAIYLAAFVAANLFLKHYGRYGLWVSSFILIPFDFVARCILHETIKSRLLLILWLLLLTSVSGIITALINFDASAIAMASVCGFTCAQLAASLWYQALIKTRPWIKVNGSDLIGIVLDSIIFQYIAFGEIVVLVTVGQIIVKCLGGLLWYYILIKKFRLYERINSGRS